jgi:hypothetical protein
MPSVALTRPDAFPDGTSVGIYPASSRNPGDVPTAAVIASGTVASNALSVTNAGILQGVGLVAYAKVGSEHRYVALRSTLDVSDTGIGSGTGNTTNGSASVTSAVASSGSFQIGQRISGPGIPPGARIKAISGGTLTLTDKATATASGVALTAEHAGSWRAQVDRRKDKIGTS